MPSTRPSPPTLQAKLQTAFQRFASRRALETGGAALTYAELSGRAAAVARAIDETGDPGRFVGIMAYRSVPAYAGVAGALLSGKAYLPFNPKFPPRRTLEMLATAGCRTIVLGPECVKLLCESLDEAGGAVPAMTIIHLPEDAPAALAARFPRHRFVSAAQGPAPQLPAAGPDDYAYLLFTSGSTGHPKGIGITQRNACAYLDFVLSKYDYRPEDRISQAFDLTFDPSVHDIFSAWLSGACLCTVPAVSLFAPTRFIQDKRLTVWYSVPSVPMFMDRLNLLKPGIFPRLRYSIFSGEALSQASAEKWQEAAPNSLVINYYGPTEATVNITYYHWDRHVSPALCRNGGAPLGHPVPEQDIRLVDREGREVPPEEPGELIVSGSQVAPGYYANPGLTVAAFRELPGQPGKKWYFTGDLVVKDRDGILFYLGRIDNQVQVLGHRVELQEVEGVIKKAAGTDLAVAVPWPPKTAAGRADELVAVVGCASDPSLIDRVVAACRTVLPSYMVPAAVLSLEPFPLNANGKIDRKAIAAFVAEARSGAGEPAMSGGDELRETILAIVKEVSALGPDFEITDATNLLSDGVLDSMGFLTLAGRVQAKLGREIPFDQHPPERFTVFGEFVKICRDLGQT